MRLHTRLRAARAAKGLTLVQLAAAAGVAVDTAHGAETGRKIPMPVNLAKIASVLELDLEELLQLIEDA